MWRQGWFSVIQLASSLSKANPSSKEGLEQWKCPHLCCHEGGKAIMKFFPFGDFKCGFQLDFGARNTLFSFNDEK